MSIAFLIRPMTASDTDSAAALHHEAFGAQSWTAADFAAGFSQAGRKGWLAQLDGKAIGFILLQIAGDEAEILTLATTTDCLRQGVATQLVQHCRQVLVGHGMKRLLLEVASDNNAARALYDKTGFTAYGVRPHYYSRGGSKIDAVLLEWLAA